MGLRSLQLITRISRTSAGVFPSTLMPFTSITSSPTWIRPERSAAPPCIMRAITIFPVSSSVFIVAPCMWWQRRKRGDAWVWGRVTKLAKPDTHNLIDSGVDKVVNIQKKDSCCSASHAQSNKETTIGKITRRTIESICLISFFCLATDTGLSSGSWSTYNDRLCTLWWSTLIAQHWYRVI